MEQAITPTTLRNEVKRAQKVMMEAGVMLPYEEVAKKYDFAVREVGAFFLFSNVSSKLTIVELLSKAEQALHSIDLLDDMEIQESRYSFDERRLVDATKAALENVNLYYLLRIEKLEDEAQNEK